MVPASSTRQAGSARGNREVGAAPAGAGGRHPRLGCVTWGGGGSSAMDQEGAVSSLPAWHHETVSNHSQGCPQKKNPTFTLAYLRFVCLKGRST